MTSPQSSSRVSRRSSTDGLWDGFAAGGAACGRAGATGGEAAARGGEAAVGAAVGARAGEATGVGRVAGDDEGLAADDAGRGELWGVAVARAEAAGDADAGLREDAGAETAGIMGSVPDVGPRLAASWPKASPKPVFGRARPSGEDPGSCGCGDAEAWGEVDA